MKNVYDTQYIELVKKILMQGKTMPCRTGNKTIKLLNQSITHDLADGFPALTFRPLPFKGMKGELTCFLKGSTDKQEFVNNSCNYWNSWANPTKAPREDKEAQRLERDLGPTYPFQFKHFGAEYDNYDTDYTNKGIDQIKAVVDTLRRDPYDRRMIISLWNPCAMPQMSLPPCIHGFQFNYLDDRLHLSVQQRSGDVCLGVPTDMMLCSLFLILMAQTVGIQPGTITLNIVDCHIYDNHINIIKSIAGAPQYELPKLALNPDSTVFNFKPDDAQLENYKTGPKVTFPIAV